MKLLALNSRGLDLTSSRFTENPSSLTIANNVYIDQQGVIRSRPGWLNNPDQNGGDSVLVGEIYSLHSNVLLNNAEDGVAPKGRFLLFGSIGVFYITLNSTGFDGCETAILIPYCAGYAPQTIPSFDSAAWFETTPYFSCSGRDLITTPISRTTGFTIGSEVAPAGLAQPVIRADGFQSPLQTDGDATDWLGEDEAVMYRVVAKTKLGDKDILSAPSEKITIVNTNSFDSKPVLRWQMPLLEFVPYSNAAFGNVIFQIYRSQTVVIAGAITDAKDELQLVYEGSFPLDAVSNGEGGGFQFEFVDYAPSGAMGVFNAPYLYTNQGSGELTYQGTGLINANMPPPAALDVATFKDCLWAAGVQPKPRLEIKLLSAEDIGEDSEFTINGTTLYATGSGSIHPGDNDGRFLYQHSGVVSYDIESTALSLCAAINVAMPDVTARYTPSAYGAPGSITIEGVSIDSTITVSSDFGDSFWPDITTDKEGTSTPRFNTLQFSKALQPNAMPALYSFNIGNPGSIIVRLVPFRDIMFVFTTQGLFMVRGQDGYSFSPETHTTWLRLVNKTAVCVCDDAVWCWTYQGFVRLTENSVEIISAPIRGALDALSAPIPQGLYSTSQQAATGDALDFLYSQAWCLAHESQHKVYFFHRSVVEDTTWQAFVFDTQMGTFTTVDNEIADSEFWCGVESAANQRLYFGARNGYVYSQRLGLEDNDFFDTNQEGTSQAFRKTVRWVAQIDEPGALKQFSEILFYYYQHPTLEALGRPTAGLFLVVGTDLVSGLTISLDAPTSDISRLNVPLSAARATQIYVEINHEAGEFFALEGASVKFENFEGRPTK